MKRLVTSCILSTLFTVNSYAFDLTSMCSQLQEDARSAKQSGLSVAEIVSIALAPGHYAKFHSLQSSEMFPGQLIPSKKIVFVVQGAKGKESEPSPEFQQNRGRMGILLRALKEPTPELCARQLLSYQWGEQEFHELQAEAIWSQQLSEVRSNQFIHRSLLRGFPEGALEIHSPFHIDELLGALRSKEASDILVITHASASGQLIDSYGNGLPRVFFGATDGNKHSLSIFSCFGKKVTGFYGFSSLGMQFAGLALVKSTEKDGVERGSPLSALPAFLKHWRKWTSLLKRNISAPVEARSFFCTLEVRGVELRGADAGVFLNQKYVGAIKRQAQLSQFEGECSPEVGANRIQIRSLGFQADSSAGIEIHNPYLKWRRGGDLGEIPLQVVEINNKVKQVYEQF